MQAKMVWLLRVLPKLRAEGCISLKEKASKMSQVRPCMFKVKGFSLCIHSGAPGIKEVPTLSFLAVLGRAAEAVSRLTLESRAFGWLDVLGC